MGYHYAERHNRERKRRELEGSRLMFRGATRFFVVVFVLSSLFVMGVGCYAQMHPNDCRIHACEERGR